MKTTKPTQCHLWKKDELTLDDLDFERVEKIIESSHLDRDIVRCKQCGQLYFSEFYEVVNFGGNDDMYTTYIPIKQYDIRGTGVRPWFCCPSAPDKYPATTLKYAAFQLPNPQIIITTVEKLLRAFENVIQMELIKVRWEEIKKLQPNSLGFPLRTTTMRDWGQALVFLI